MTVCADVDCPKLLDFLASFRKKPAKTAATSLPFFGYGRTMTSPTMPRLSCSAHL
jgi:hypothetical protein